MQNFQDTFETRKRSFISLHECTFNKHNKSVSWIKMHDIQDKLGVKNKSDLKIKSIKDIYDTKIPTKEQIEKYKIH